MFPYRAIKDYHDALRSAAITCTDAVHHYLAEIRAHQHLNAFLEVFEDESLARAAALDLARKNGEPLAPLHGVVVGIKDVLCYQGHRVSAASRMLEDYVAIYNATAIQKLLDAGAIIIGRQNCDEFAMGSSNENSAYGPVKNFLDPSLVPGGSSGGSAVAVQAGMCMVSLGSDTGGSVRQPADFCGIIGMKPTYGRISRYGLIAYASSFDQIGIFGREINDVALVLEVIAGIDEYDSTVADIPVPSYSRELRSPAESGRLAYIRQAVEHPSLDPAIRTALLDFFNVLRAEGCEVDAVDMEWLDEIVPAYYVLTTAEASSNLSRYDGVRYGFRAPGEPATIEEMYTQTRSQGFGKEVQRRILLGNFVLSAGYFDAYFNKAQQVRRLLSDASETLFASYSCILMPTVPSPAFRLGEKSTDPIAMYLGDIYTVLANLVGSPAISIPLFRHPNGLPFGLQLMTARFNELSLLRLSDRFLQLSGKTQSA